MTFNRYISAWFEKEVGKATEAQRRCWPLIQSGANVLLSAPTGTGKTFAAFLSQINRLTELSLAGKLESKIYTVYVSPLKALSHDIEKNLSLPLRQIESSIKEKGDSFHSIQVAVRTGDTSQSDRQKILKNPPHILVTTPESLYLMLTAKKSRALLSHVEKVIVDEIHSVAGDKRGSHLALTLERLENNSEATIQRIGLSATQSPIEEIRDFLVGCNRSCEVIEVEASKKRDLGVMIPRKLLSSVCSHEQWDELYKQMEEQISKHHTTLIFVNTRKLAERMAHHFKDVMDPELVGCHHGSLSREKRLSVERGLKAGDLKVVVATASLELGIDIGSVDLVLQVGSSRAIATFLQRLGRAGHQVGGVSKARIVCLTREELVEAAAMITSVQSALLDAIVIPQKPFDILAQQIVAETAAFEECSAADLWQIFTRAHSYRDLTKEEFYKVVELLEVGLAKNAPVGRYINFDDTKDILRARPGARLAAITSGGAIPELAEYRVVSEDGTFVGTLDEEFAVESGRGDIFLLGNHSWCVEKVEAGRVIVSDAQGQAPTVPFWQGEAPGRTIELSAAVSNLREQLDSQLTMAKIDLLRDVLVHTEDEYIYRDCAVFLRQREIFPESYHMLNDRCCLAKDAIDQIIFYLVSQKIALGLIPTQKKVVFERFFDDTGSMHLIVHAPFGQKINKAWGLAMRKSYCRSFDFELQAAADDNGFGLALGPGDGARLKSLFKMVNPRNLYGLVEQAILQIPLFQVRWRWNLNRSLSVLRFSGGKRVLPHLQRYRADDLLTASFPQKTMCFEHITGDIELPNHPYVQQTMRDCMEEAMDYQRLHKVLLRAEKGDIEFFARDVSAPSPFSHELIHANPYAFLDEAPLEERRTRAVNTPRLSLDDLKAGLHISDDALTTVLATMRPVVRNLDEFYSLLKRAGLLPRELFNQYSQYVNELVKENKAFWPKGLNGQLLVHHKFSQFKDNLVVELSSNSEIDFLDDALFFYLTSCGPMGLSRMTGELGLPNSLLQRSLARLESQGQILHGSFTCSEEQWCTKAILTRLSGATVRKQREQVKTLTAESFIDFSIFYHQLDHRTKDKNRSFREVVSLLEGFEAPGSVWESELLADRLPQFSRSLVDEWTLSGRVLWFRVPNQKSLNMKGVPRLHGRTPVVFVRRENLKSFLALLELPQVSDLKLEGLVKEVFEALKTNGALFLDEISSKIGLTKHRLIPVVSEMMHRGLISADGFSAYRGLIKFKPRRDVNRPSYNEAKIIDAVERAGRFCINPCLLVTPDVEKEEAHRFWAEVLLRRYGVICRDLLQRESFGPKWRDLFAVYRSMELRGEIRCGRFIQGADGMQYCDTETFEIWKKFCEADGFNWQVISAADPCNLFGVITEGKRVTALRHTKILVDKGKVEAIYQNGDVRFNSESHHSKMELFSRALKVSGPIRRLDPFLMEEENKSSQTSVDERQQLRPLSQFRSYLQ